jgi:phage terminase large subunit-like protein
MLRLQRAALLAKRARTLIARRLGDKREVVRAGIAGIILARTCIPCRTVVSSASALWNPGDVLGQIVS